MNLGQQIGFQCEPLVNLEKGYEFQVGSVVKRDLSRVIEDPVFIMVWLRVGAFLERFLKNEIQRGT